MTPEHDLAQKVSPAIQAVLLSHKEEIIQRSGGLIVRWAINMAYTSIINLVPIMTESALDVIAIALKNMTFEDALNWINVRAALAQSRRNL